VVPSIVPSRKNDSTERTNDEASETTTTTRRRRRRGRNGDRSSIAETHTRTHTQSIMSRDVLDSVLTPEEREWAFALEEALYGADEERKRARKAARRSFVARAKKGGGVFDPWNEVTNNANNSATMPTDFELATHAIIAKGDTSRALKRIKRLREFKERYRVPNFECGYENDEYNEANIDGVLLVIKKFLSAYPDFVKSIGMDKHGRIAAVLRMRGLRWSHPPPFNHTESDRFKALYCLMHALQPTPESVRRGTVWIADLGGVTARPSGPFTEGFRKLLRDSYPVRVQDVPVVRCPPLWSGAFAGTYPFWSRHFANRFVRVDPATLRSHFPADLLQGGRKKSASSSAAPDSTLHRHRRHQKEHQRRQQQQQRTRKVASNDNNWENLDDDGGGYDDYDNSNSNSNNNEWSDWTSVGSGSLGGIEAAKAASRNADGRAVANEEMWNTIERLVRTRFKTERTFRVA